MTKLQNGEQATQSPIESEHGELPITMFEPDEEKEYRPLRALFEMAVLFFSFVGFIIWCVEFYKAIPK